MWKDRRAKRMGIAWYCAVVQQNPRGMTLLENIAKHPTPRPERIHHVLSAVMKAGYRHYAFNSESQRDGFVKDWPTASACEDPVP